MGVSGAGKTRIGRELARELGWPFLDADDFHPAENIAKMRGGVPLEPPDRTAWLRALREALVAAQQSGGNVVLACSALREEFRDALRAGFDDMRFVYLRADRALVRARVERRADHFMPASLVDSQFDTLEEPADAVVVDAAKAPEVIVQDLVRTLAPNAS